MASRPRPPAGRRQRRTVGDRKRAPKHRVVAEAGHEASPTAVVAEAWRTGVLPSPPRRPEEIPHEDQTIRVGDPDDNSLANEYVGEDTPGGSTPTPDQNSLDEIGRVYGLAEEDTGALRSGEEILTRRDRHRAELRPPRKPEA
jgi:Family of unknown function (DUF6335)